MRVGVIGMGSIGVRHARNLMQLGHRVYAYDTAVTEAAQSNFNYIYDIVEFFKSIEAVVIATPTDLHAIYLGHAVAAKKPAFVEKPLGAIPQIDCLRNLISEAGRNEMIVQVGCNQRYNKGIIAAKQKLDRKSVV